MKDERASQTADVAAAVRAAHQIYDRPIVFIDPFAIDLTSRFWRRIVGNRVLHWIIVRKIMRVFRPVHGQMVGRARFAEDGLQAAVDQGGIGQYVIIGAGMDSFALRRPPASRHLRIFEIDHPATQAEKKRRIETLDPGGGPHAEYLPADLEKQDVATVLSASSFDTAAPAFFSWLGTTHYLTEDAVYATLKSIADFAASGSEIVFDYSLPDSMLSSEDKAELDAIKDFVKGRGEPFVSSFKPGELADRAGAMGYRVIEDLSYDEQMRRYFTRRSDDLRPSAFSRFAHLYRT